MSLAGLRILMVAAGTGGHIIPGIVLGRRMAQAGASVLYFCGCRPIERTIYTAAGIVPDVLSWPGASSGVLEKLVRLGRMGYASAAAVSRVLSLRPDALISMGGGFSAPFLAAAATARIPFFLHESNAVPGRVTRTFASTSSGVFLGMPTTMPVPKSIVVGTPVREAAIPTARVPGRIVVMGGSQGARRLNQIAARAAELASAHLPGLAMTIIGPTPEGPVPACVEHVPYVEDPIGLLGSAEVVISRAGASSLAEYARHGIPSVLVPFPFSKDAHQDANAAWFARAGAAMVCSETSLTPEALADRLREVLADGGVRRDRMAAAAASLWAGDPSDAIIARIGAVVARCPNNVPTAVLTNSNPPASAKT